MAKTPVNRITGRMASAAADVTTLTGTIEVTKSANEGIVVAVPAAAAPTLARSAAPAPCGIGTSASSAGVNSPAMAEPPTSTTMNQASARRAMAPARAAATVCTTPVNSRATTSGRIVARSARSHRSPSGPATARIGGRAAGAAKARPSPRARPPTRPRKIHSAGTRVIGAARLRGRMKDR
jgi:hypothetical protein